MAHRRAARPVAGSAGDPLAEAVELTRRLKLPHIRRHLVELDPDRAGAALGPRRARPGPARRGGRRPRRGEPAHPPRTRRVPRREDLGRLGRRRVLHPAPHPGRPDLAGVGGTPGEPVRLRPVGHRQVATSARRSGQAAVEAGMTVAWFTIEDLGALVRRHRADDSITRALARLIRTDLIIVDDIGLLPGQPGRRRGLLPARRRRLRTPLAGGQLEPAPVRVRRDHAQDPGHRHGRPAAAPRPHRRHPG